MFFTDVPKNKYMKQCFLLFFLSVPIGISAGYRGSYPLEEGKREFNYDNIFSAIAAVESNFNPMAVNHSEKAVGMLQVRPICLKDVNNFYGTNYSHDEMYNPIKAAHVFILYTKMYGAETYEEMARIWNGGPKGMRKKSTLRYWSKVKRKLNNLSHV